MYKDILHFSHEQLTIRFNKELETTLNKAFIDHRNAWGKLDEIKEVHWFKLMLTDLILNTDDLKELKSLVKDLRLCEFELQGLFGLSKDANFHRFWEYKKCECPKLDNLEAYPHRQIINLNCPLHGED